MYDEFERAVTGRSRKGMPFLAWAGAILFFVVAFGIAGAGWAALRVKSEVEETIRRVEREVHREVGRSARLQRSAAAGEILANLRPGLGNLTDHPEESLRMLRDLHDAELSASSLQESIEGSFRVRGEDGEVRGDFQGDEEGGFLVIQTPDGEVRLELEQRGEGGLLTLRGPDGAARLELVGGEDGGQLLLETEEGTVRLGSGWGAEEIPAWVPRLGGMPDAPRQVYSASSDEGFMGAVTWEDAGDPKEVLAFYRARLAEAGYEVKAEHALREGDHSQGSLWARHADDGRMVFVVAEADDDASMEILLGYGQEIR